MGRIKMKLMDFLNTWTRRDTAIEELEWQIPRDGLEGPYWFAVKGNGWEFYIKCICGLTYRIDAGQEGSHVHHYAPMCGYEAHVILKDWERVFETKEQIKERRRSDDTD